MSDPQYQNSSPNSVAPQNITYFSDGNVLRDLGRLEARVDALTKDIERLSKYGDRIEALVKWQYTIAGGAVVLSLLLSAFGPLILKFFHLS